MNPEGSYDEQIAALKHRYDQLKRQHPSQQAGPKVRAELERLDEQIELLEEQQDATRAVEIRRLPETPSPEPEEPSPPPEVPPPELEPEIPPGREPTDREQPRTPDPAEILHEAKTWGGWLALVLSAIGGTPLQVILVKAVQGPELGIEEAKLIWSVFWLTVPLTSTLAILLLLALFGYFTNKNQWDSIAIVGLALLASAIVGNLLGLKAAGLDKILVVLSTDVYTHPLLRLIKATLGAYFTAYGAQLFFQSIVLAVVIGLFVARQVSRHASVSH